ncbi:uncharacterized protein [Macrobrachium rosenbergii]|uniref:uncharacterized protein n=1 Tax=Macrobrachium rosenbergii TaxID=79674 RepID=UPI0034D48612
MHHAVPLPPGFLATFARPGPSYMVTSTLPYVTDPAPVADPGPISTMVPASRFSIQPGTSSFPLPIPSTLVRPGLAAQAPPVPAFLAPPTFIPGQHAVAPAQVSAGPSTTVSTRDAPSAAASPPVPESSAAPAWYGDLTAILKKMVKKKKKRSRKVPSSSSSSSSSSLSAASSSSPTEASRPKKKKSASPRPEKSRTETSKGLPPSTGKAVGSLVGSSRSTDQGTAALTSGSVASGAKGVQTKVCTPPAVPKKIPASKASESTSDTRTRVAPSTWVSKETQVPQADTGETSRRTDPALPAGTPGSAKSGSWDYALAPQGRTPGETEKRSPAQSSREDTALKKTGACPEDSASSCQPDARSTPPSPRPRPHSQPGLGEVSMRFGSHEPLRSPRETALPRQKHSP